MLKNKKLLFDFKEEIKNKYGYDEELAETIAMTAESIIDYMGSEYESIILEAISSCKYIIANNFKLDENGKQVGIAENIYDVLKREGMLEHIEGSTVNDGDLKRAGGVYTSVPRISEHEGKFTIDSIDRVIVLPNYFNHNNPASLGTASHETMHLVKAYVKEYEIEGNKLKQRFGLGHGEYSLGVQGGKVIRTLIKETGIGTEEGANTYDELSLIRNTYDSNYEVYGYPYQRSICGYLADGIGLGPIIREAQLTGDIDEVKKLFDTHIDIGFEGFNEKMDETVRLEYERFANIFDEEKYKESLDKLQKLFETELAPRVRSFEASLKPEMSEQHVIG